jgi:cold shock protein
MRRLEPPCLALARILGRQLHLSELYSRASENAQMAEGTIKKLTDRGFGFIKTDSGKDLFFHMSALDGVNFEELQVGQKVSFNEAQGPKGPCAENVKPA